MQRLELIPLEIQLHDADVAVRRNGIIYANDLTREQFPKSQMIIRYYAALQLLVGLSLLALISNALGAPLTTCTPVTIANGPASLPEEQEDPAVSGSNIYLAYSGSSGLVFRMSHDGGLTWASNVLDPTGILPRIVASGNNVYIVWLTGAGANWSLEFARSTDKGATFLPAVVLGPFHTSHKPTGDDEVQIAVSGPLVAIISDADATDMVVDLSNDHGRTFSQALLPTFGVDAEEEYIAAFGRNIAAVWNDVGSDGLTKIMLSTSADAGQTFSPPQNLTADGIDAREPLFAVSPNTGSLYMVWRESGTPYGATVGFLSKSTDFGATWSTPQLVDPGVTRGRQFSVAAVDPNVYVTYMRHHQADGYWWPRLLVSHNGAMSFGASISLGNSGLTGVLGTEEHAPRLWANGAWLRIVYGVHGKLFMSASGNSGVSFGARMLLGPGASALVTQNTALWLADNGSVQFAICK